MRTFDLEETANLIIHFCEKMIKNEKCTFYYNQETKQSLDNNEIQNLIQSLGCGIGKNFDSSKLRYEKIILIKFFQKASSLHEFIFSENFNSKVQRCEISLCILGAETH